MKWYMIEINRDVWNQSKYRYCIICYTVHCIWSNKENWQLFILDTEIWVSKTCRQCKVVEQPPRGSARHHPCHRFGPSGHFVCLAKEPPTDGRTTVNSSNPRGSELECAVAVNKWNKHDSMCMNCNLIVNWTVILVMILKCYELVFERHWWTWYT